MTELAEPRRRVALTRSHVTTFKRFESEGTAVPRLTLRVIQVASAVLALLVLGRVAMSVARGSELSHESGVWTALAMDAAHGVLYRPLLGPDGVGGTRAFPLQIVLHSILIRLGLSPVLAGFALMLASAALFLGSGYRLMRKLNVPACMAWPICVLITCTESAGMALTMIRGDLMAAALNVTALSICVGALRKPVGFDRGEFKKSDAWIAVAGVLFALTFLAKMTSVFAFLAVAVVLLRRGEVARKTLTLFVSAFAVIAFGGLVGVEIASHGNFLANLRATGALGVLGSLRHLPIILSQLAIDRDPIGFAFIILGVAAVSLSRGRAVFELLPLTFLSTTVVTLFVFVLPGADRNDLMDLQVTGIVLIAVCMTRGGDAARMFSGAVACIAVAAIGPAWIGVRDALPRRAMQETILAKSMTINERGPMLSDFTLLPVLNGERPYLLDDATFAALARSNPRVRADLFEKIDARFFSVVIVKVDPELNNRLDVWGSSFVDHLAGGYEEGEPMGGFIVYRRRHSPA